MNSRIDPDEDDALRRAFAQDPSPSTEDPVDADALWDAVRGDAEPRAVAALADRMARDPALAEDWRVARAFAAEAAASAAEAAEAADADQEHAEAVGLLPTEVVAAEPANRGDYLRWGALLAVVAAAVLLVLAWPRGGAAPYDPDDGRMRGGADGIEAIRGDGPVARDRAVLEWSEVPDAVRYELYVSTTELQPVLEERELKVPSMTLPAELLRDRPAGTELLWRVEAVFADGRREISETFALAVQ